MSRKKLAVGAVAGIIFAGGMLGATQGGGGINVFVGNPTVPTPTATATPDPGVANIWINTVAGASPSRCSTACAYDSTHAYGPNWNTGYSASTCGDVIRVRNGNYPNQDLTKDCTVDNTLIGQSKAGVVVGAGAGSDDTTCTERGDRPDSYFCAEANHLFMQDVTVDIGTDDGTEAIGSLIGGSNTTYKNVDLLGDHPDMVVEGGGSGFLWDGGTYADPGPHEKLCGHHYGETVWIQEGADNVTVNRVVFNPQTTDLSCDPDNPHVEFFRIESGSSNITLSNNIYMPGSDAGSGYIFMSVSDTTNFRIIGNFFADNSGTTWAQIPNQTVALIAYNTFSGNDGFAGNATAWVGNLGPQQGCGGTHTKNVWSGTGTCGTDTFVGATSLGVNSSTGALSAGSPAINSAETTCSTNATAFDRDLDPRPVGVACDAGSDEYPGG